MIGRTSKRPRRAVVYTTINGPQSCGRICDSIKIVPLVDADELLTSKIIRGIRQKRDCSGQISIFELPRRA